jgi:hypothetical protein
MSSTITISRRYATFAIVATIGALCGLLFGWVIFSRPALSPSTVPPAALRSAYKAGLAILQGTTPDSLAMDVFTTNIAWTGTPVVTWSGKNFIDVCLIAHTQAGTLAIEMRLVRKGELWAVDQLLSLQLREAK